MVVMSTLARKVFDQTSIPQDIIWAWWVEQRLQKMAINGLVKMIQSSKKLEINYIDGYLLKYKWSYRDTNLVISGHGWAFSVIQEIGEDFDWGLWSKIVQLKAEYFEIFSEAIGTALARGISNLSYAMAIYESEVFHLEQIYQKVCNPIIPTKKCVTSKGTEELNKIKGLL